MVLIRRGPPNPSSLDVELTVFANRALEPLDLQRRGDAHEDDDCSCSSFERGVIQRCSGTVERLSATDEARRYSRPIAAGAITLSRMADTEVLFVPNETGPILKEGNVLLLGATHTIAAPRLPI